MASNSDQNSTQDRIPIDICVPLSWIVQQNFRKTKSNVPPPPPAAAAAAAAAAAESDSQLSSLTSSLSSALVDCTSQERVEIPVDDSNTDIVHSASESTSNYTSGLSFAAVAAAGMETVTVTVPSTPLERFGAHKLFDRNVLFIVRAFYEPSKSP
jgi:hypothetical protein